MLSTGAVVTACVMGLMVFGGALWVHRLAAQMPSLDELEAPELGQNSQVIDRGGERMGYVSGSEYTRRIVPLSAIPRQLQDAVVAIEDKRFFQHEGVDWYRMGGALVHDIMAGGFEQGGSTLTMQLVKNVYHSPTAARSLDRKLDELYLAMQIEQRYSKREILERYLNSVFFGQGAIGVQAASLTYFSRPVTKLNLAQSALLAGLPQSPSTLNPLINPDGARTRRNLVLDQMIDQGMVTPAAGERAKVAGLGLDPAPDSLRTRQDPYVFDAVEREVEAELGRERLQLGGLTIRTTVDRGLQRHAESVLQDTLDWSGDPEAAIVVLDARTGQVRAAASSTRYADSQFNLATQARRQAGSTFKTFTLARAIADGINPDTTYYESAPIDEKDPKYGPIKVRNFSDTYRGTTSIHSAILASDNAVFTKLLLDVGPEQTARLMRQMGITSEVRSVPALGLGATPNGVSVLEMARAYAPLANGGFRVSPTFVAAIRDRHGRPVQRNVPPKERVLDETVAKAVTELLEENVQSGTGTAADLGIAQAGKTGTANDYSDAWFVGYTPDYVAAVWVGYPKGQIPMRSVHGIPVTGGSFPAQIWRDVMKYATEGKGTSTWPTVVGEPAWQTDFQTDRTAG